MGKAELPLHAPGTQVDKGYIGQSVPRPNAARLLQGRGAFTDDLRFPRLAHVAFFRSPYAHARIKRLDFSKARTQPGVIGVFDGRAVAEYCTPWVAVLAHLKGIKSPPQHAIAIERACWQGEAVAAVVAESRTQAEDAVQVIEAEWDELPVVVDMEASLEGKTVIHPDFTDNICFNRELDTGGVDEVFAKADVVVEDTFHFGRHTGVCLEGRAILADYNAGEHSLTVYHATQAPHMMQDIFSRHLGIPEANVRVISKDVGGSFGIKVHVYADEMATAALSVMLRRPVKFLADRLESFLSDIHAREHRARVRLACSKAGEILAFELDDLTAIGPYSVYPRTSGIEGNQVVNLTGGPYKHQKYKARLNVVFTNKNLTCQYRAVGHPIAVALTEGIVDLAAQKLGMDPAEFRRKNLIADDAYPYTFPSGIKFEKLSHHKALDLLLKITNYSQLRQEQATLRKKGVYRGIGLAAMIEVTNPSPAFYGVGGARISAQDGATLRFEPTGMVTVMCSVTEQGQGTEGIFAQIAASAVGVTMDKVKVITGDTGVTPYGGGTWASRGAGIGGEAVLLAGRALRSNMLDVAAAVLKMDKADLDVRENNVINKLTLEKKFDLAELGRVAYFRPDTLPMDFQSELTVTRHYTPRQYGFTFTNGIQASLVEVDPDTGFVKLLKHWCVEDSGTVINPMLVDEQLRGGVVQGIGAALYEECLYSPEGQLLNGNMADYLVPMSGEMPDIVCAHIETPTLQSQLGAKGVGEAGTAGAPAAIMNAINDALAPLNARVTRMPFTPERILQALRKSSLAIDPRVSSAISHWAPRFVSNGVLLADFEDVTKSLTRWEEWCAAWSDRAAVHESLGRVSLKGGFKLTASEHLIRAAIYYHFAKFVFVQDVSQMRAAHMKAVACYRDGIAHARPPGERVEVPYENRSIYGVLRKPNLSNNPVLIMAPGLDSTKEEIHAYEEPFLARGIAVLAIDGPGQGEAEYDIPICGDYERAAAAVVDWIEGRKDLNAKKIGIWGVSLGGYYSPRAAAYEKRIKACIALSGPYEWDRIWDGLPELTRETFRVRSHAKDEMQARAVAKTLTMKEAAPRITCPIFIVTGRQDRLVPASHAEQLAKAVSGPVELMVVEDGGHNANNRPYRYRSRTADWLAGQFGLPRV